MIKLPTDAYYKDRLDALILVRSQTELSEPELNQVISRLEDLVHRLKDCRPTKNEGVKEYWRKKKNENHQESN